MNMLRPYSTLAIGIALGLFVVRPLLSKVNVNVPG